MGLGSTIRLLHCDQGFMGLILDCESKAVYILPTPYPVGWEPCLLDSPFYSGLPEIVPERVGVPTIRTLPLLENGCILAADSHFLGCIKLYQYSEF